MGSRPTGRGARAAGLLRSLARGIRAVAPASGLDGVWDRLRPPYHRLLRGMAGSRGVEVRVGGHAIRIDPAFAGVDWERFEHESYRTFAATVRPGLVVYDVGAHIGTYTLIALERSAPDGMVVAYEPQSTALEYLRRHLEWSGSQDRALVRERCCGARSGVQPFYHLDGGVEGASGLLPVEGFTTAEVDVTTLDAEVAERGPVPTILKIDVEGAELDVLRGAEETLAAHRPTLFLSVHPQALSGIGLAPQDLKDWLGARGYGWRVLGEDYELHVLAEPC